MSTRDDLRRRWTALASSLVFVSLPACATLLDFQDPTDRAPDGGASSASSASPFASDAATPAAPGDACACPAVPAGWRGPLHLATTSTTGTLEDCSGDAPTLDYEGSADLIAPPAQCSCACGAPAGVTCGAVTAALYTDPTCLTTCAAATSSLTTCARVIPSSSSCIVGNVRGIRATSTVTGGACAPIATTDIAEPVWGTKIRLCGGGSTCACGANVCIAQPGAHPCPAAFPVAHEAFNGVADSRACTTCECAAPTGSACSAAISAYGTSCVVPTATGTLDGSCLPITSGGRVTTTDPVATGGACAAAGGEPTGSITPSNPTTICCLQ